MFGALQKKKWFHLLVFIPNKGKKEVVLINVLLILRLGIK